MNFFCSVDWSHSRNKNMQISENHYV